MKTSAEEPCGGVPIRDTKDVRSRKIQLSESKHQQLSWVTMWCGGNQEMSHQERLQIYIPKTDVRRKPPAETCDQEGKHYQLLGNHVVVVWRSVAPGIKITNTYAKKMIYEGKHQLRCVIKKVNTIS